MKHYLTLCAIFRDEADYLDEWLRFYDLVGVERFVLFDNGRPTAAWRFCNPGCPLDGSSSMWPQSLTCNFTPIAIASRRTALSRGG